jgi:iron complex transport system substrate-binding protein
MLPRPVAMQAIGLNRPCASALLAASLLLAGCGKAPEPQAVAAPTRQHQPALELPVCGQTVRYDKVPQRAVTHDVNITESFLYLGLGRRLVGYSGIPPARRSAPSSSPGCSACPIFHPRA